MSASKLLLLPKSSTSAIGDELSELAHVGRTGWS